MPSPARKGRSGPATRPRADTRFERRRRRNREALLAAAVELFQQRGLRAVKLEDICDRADVAPRTFFNHFETREHLVAAIAQQRAARFAALFETLERDPRPVAQRLPELLREIAAYLEDRPLYRELVGEMLHVRGDGGGETARGRTLGRAAQRFVADAAGRGEITAPFAPEVLADLLLGALTTALVNWTADDGYDLAAALDESARALVALFTAPASPPPRPAGR